MSLINDALKKAQKQREVPEGTPPPGVPPVAPAAPAPAPAPRGNTFTLLIAAAAVLISGSVAATVYFLRSPGPREATVATASPAAKPSTPTVSAVAASAAPSAPVAATPSLVRETPPPAPAISAPPTASPPAPRKSEASVAVSFPSTTVPTPTAIPAPIVPPQPAPAEAAPRAAAPEIPQVKASFRIQGMIDKFRISGIRLSDTDSKVILNDHLFRVNELVEPSLGLRLVKIESHLLTFTDGDQNVYLKHF